jgi:hypothetical protein
MGAPRDEEALFRNGGVVKFPLTTIWLAANARRDIRMKVFVYLICDAITTNTAHQRKPEAYERLAQEYLTGNW